MSTFQDGRGRPPGSIIAAIIVTHRATKDASGPSSVETPMSISLICRTATTQDAAASPNVAASAAAVSAILALVLAANSPAIHAPSHG